MPLKKPCAATVVRAELVIVFIMAGLLAGAGFMAIHEHTALEQERRYYQAQRVVLQADANQRCSISLKELADRCRCELIVK